MLGAGLAQLDAHVDEAGRETGAGAVDHLAVAGGRQLAAELGDASVLDKEVAGTVEIARRVEQPGVAEEGARVHQTPATALSLRGARRAPRQSPTCIGAMPDG